FFQAEDGIRDRNVTGVQTCALRSVLDCVENGDNIFTGFDGLHVPPIRLVAGVDIFGESNVGVIFDGDAVVIPKDNEVAQLLGTGQRGSFGGHALLQITIGCDDVDVVVER